MRAVHFHFRCWPYKVFVMLTKFQKECDKSNGSSRYGVADLTKFRVENSFQHAVWSWKFVVHVMNFGHFGLLVTNFGSVDILSLGFFSVISNNLEP